MSGNGRSRPRATVKVVDGLSSWDLHLPDPTLDEVAIVHQLFACGLVEGETYMGDRWPVLLLRWTEQTR